MFIDLELGFLPSPDFTIPTASTTLGPRQTSENLLESKIKPEARILLSRWLLLFEQKKKNKSVAPFEADELCEMVENIYPTYKSKKETTTAQVIEYEYAMARVKIQQANRFYPHLKHNSFAQTSHINPSSHLNGLSWLFCSYMTQTISPAPDFLTRPKHHANEPRHSLAVISQSHFSPHLRSHDPPPSLPSPYFSFPRISPLFHSPSLYLP